MLSAVDVKLHAFPSRDREFLDFARRPRSTCSKTERPVPSSGPSASATPPPS